MGSQHPRTSSSSVLPSTQFYHAGVLQPILKFLSPGWLFPDSWHLFGWTGTLTIYTATGTASFYAYLYKEVLKLAMCNLQFAAGDPAHWTQHVGALALLSAQLSVGCQRRWTGYTLGHSFLHSWSQVSRVMSLKTTAVLLRHSADLNKVLLCTRIQIHAHTRACWMMAESSLLTGREEDMDIELTFLCRWNSNLWFLPKRCGGISGREELAPPVWRALMAGILVTLTFCILLPC